MCGICGELNFTGKTPDLATLDRMRDKLISRGPNQSGIYTNGPLAFGHRRLTIIDPSFRSHQPVTDHNLGITIVFNGTIYNHPALREELKNRGYSFFSEGDTEVILLRRIVGADPCVCPLLYRVDTQVYPYRQRTVSSGQYKATARRTPTKSGMPTILRNSPQSP